MSNSTNSLFGFYEGIIIANNDPLQSGRVLVFIPQIHMSLLNLKNKDYNKRVVVGNIGKNVTKGSEGNLDITDYIEELKERITTWSVVSQPIMGETGEVKYNASTSTATDSDSNNFKTSALGTDKKSGQPPSGLYNNMTDAFAGTESGGLMTNPYGGSYINNTLPNKPKGVFGTPNVGTRVLVIFLNGNPQSPVVVSKIPSTSEWQSMYDPATAPGSYENAKKGTGGSTTDQTTYRNEAVIVNQSGLSISTNNSMGFQSANISHPSGSGLTFTDGATIRTSTNNDQLLVAGDRFQTVKGSGQSYTGNNRVTVVRGDNIRRIGSLNAGAAAKHAELLSGIHENKKLFDVQRASNESVYSSQAQKKSGTNGPCPVCKGGKKMPIVSSNPYTDVKKVVVNNKSNPKEMFNFILGMILKMFTQEASVPATSECNFCKGSGLSPSSAGGDFPKEPAKEKIPQQYLENAVPITQAEADLGEGGSEIVEVTRHMVINVGCVKNKMDSIRVDKKGKSVASGVQIDKQSAYANMTASPLIEPVHVDDLAGGNYTVRANNKAEIIAGAGGMKIDTYGQLNLGGSITNVTGAQLNLSSMNEINLSSCGNIALKGAALNMTSGSGQVFIGDSLGVNQNMIVGGGAHIEGELSVNHITAPVEIQQTEQVDELYGRGNPNLYKRVSYIQKNVPYKAIVNGETATIIFLEDVPTLSKTPGGSVSDDNSILNYSHSHLFKNIPLTLSKSNEKMRESIMSGINSNSRVVATAVKNERKTPK